MRAILAVDQQDALEAWVDEHAAQFDNVAIYKHGLTMYCVGVPPTTIRHHPGHITDALAAALESVRRWHS